MSRVRASGTRVVRPIMVIRHLHGGSQSVLLMGDDGRNYITKFTGNPQGSNVLANEWIGTALARAVGLPVANSAMVQVSKTFLERNQDIAFHLGNGIVQAQPGLQFGSQMVRAKRGDPPLMQYVPTSQREYIQNLPDFIGIALFDLVTEMDDYRQAIFLRHPHNRTIKATFIDFGHLLQGPNWDHFRLARLNVHPALSFYPDLWQQKRMLRWVSKFQRTFPRALRQAVEELPSGWYSGDVKKMQDRLLERLELAPALIRSLATEQIAAPLSLGQPDAPQQRFA